MKPVLFIFVFFLSETVFSQSNLNSQEFNPIEIYHSESLIITQISKNTYLHTSFLLTNDFGKVPCNGMLVKNKNEALVFDTPTNNKASDELITFINSKLLCHINAIVPTHFHEDCLGGLEAFHQAKIPSFGNDMTIELAKATKVLPPQSGFKDSLRLNLGNSHVTIKYFGQGHTKDNVVAYFPSEKILFGGCLIKELNASKGYLGDANVGEWSNTVQNVKRQFPEVKIVIPGHGKIGGEELLDYTIKLFGPQ